MFNCFKMSFLRFMNFSARKLLDGHSLTVKSPPTRGLHPRITGVCPRGKLTDAQSALLFAGLLVVPLLFPTWVLMNLHEYSGEPPKITKRTC
ncbi:UNVERIFIED_CONTAM: hypothetical protein PYX00_003895 [Menopon gallinae]|uniref:Uncharacterized protein n=1 Tax=Menopon gallinae TaxID=328185 RepID=A0AAW2I3A4_9NEOP